VAGERAVEWLRGMAMRVEVMISQKEGDVKRVVQEIGDTLFASHMNGGRRRKVESSDVLERIAQEWVLTEVRAGIIGVPRSTRERC